MHGTAHRRLLPLQATWSLAMAFLGASLALSFAVALAEQPAGLAAPSFVPVAAVPTADQHNVMLMLDDGPLHLRLRLAIAAVSLNEVRNQYVTRLLQSLDQDGDGRLNRAEANGSPLLRTKRRPGAAKFLEGLNAQLQLQRRDLELLVDRMGGEIIAFRQDLTSAQNDVEVFKLLDRDGSGTLDAAESQSAADLILSKDTDGDECVSFTEFFPPPPPANPLERVRSSAAAAPPPTIADLVRQSVWPPAITTTAAVSTRLSSRRSKRRLRTLS